MRPLPPGVDRASSFAVKALVLRSSPGRTWNVRPQVQWISRSQRKSPSGFKGIGLMRVIATHRQDAGRFGACAGLRWLVGDFSPQCGYTTYLANLEGIFRAPSPAEMRAPYDEPKPTLTAESQQALSPVSFA